MVMNAELLDGIRVGIVGWYINGQLFFSEFTLFDGSGFIAFEPAEWDYKVGALLKLPKKQC